MPTRILCPPLRIPLEPLTPAAFFPFGTVISNPSTSPYQFPNPLSSTTANQGSAVKYLDVTQLTNHYVLAPSKKPAKPVVNMFSCAPRKLRRLVSRTSAKNASGQTIVRSDEQRTLEKREGIQLFDVSILERHPYTPQTFIPVGLSASDSLTAYLVIVAPTLTSSNSKTAQARASAYPPPEPKPRRSLKDLFLRARPSPFTNEHAPSPARAAPTNTDQRPKGPGRPDLTQVRAFIARGDQAVTYTTGTWHAPMVVLGVRTVDFVVLQYANGVTSEDCQEILLERQKGEVEGIVVEVEVDRILDTEQNEVLGIADLTATAIRAKL